MLHSSSTTSSYYYCFGNDDEDVDEDEDEEDSDIPEKESVVAEAAAETDVVAEAEDAGVVDSGVDAGTPVAIEAGDARATAAMGTDMEDKDVPDTPQGGTAETKEVAETKDPAAGADDSPPQASEQGEGAVVLHSKHSSEFSFTIVIFLLLVSVLPQQRWKQSRARKISQPRLRTLIPRTKQSKNQRKRTLPSRNKSKKTLPS